MKTFQHSDGRRLLVFDDSPDGWWVELRTGPVQRTRWDAAGERRAAAVARHLMGDDEGWTDVTWT